MSGAVTMWRPDTDLGKMLSSDGRVLWHPTLAAADGFRVTVDTATPDNTGCDTSKLTKYTGGTLTLSASDAGREFTNMWFPNGIINKVAPFVKFRNCMVNQNPTQDGTTASSKNPGGNRIAANFNSTAAQACLFEMCTFEPDSSVSTVDSLCYPIIGVNTHSIRCRFSDGWTDAYNAQTTTTIAQQVQFPGANVSIGDYFAPHVYDTDVNQNGGRSHSDGIQFANGRDYLIIGSHLAAVVGDSYSHGMVVGPYAAGGIGGMTLLGCDFSGGGAQFSAWANGVTDWSPVVPGLELIGCKFDATGCLVQKKSVTNYVTGEKASYWVPQSILLTPAARAGARLVNNVQTVPCTPQDSSVPAFPNGFPLDEHGNTAFMLVTANG